MLHWTTQLSTDELSPSDHHDADCQESKNHKDGDRESQFSRVHSEDRAVGTVVNGCDQPGQTDAKEHVDSVTPRHVTD